MFTEEEYKNAKPSDLLPLKCKQCGRIFYKSKSSITYAENHKDTHPLNNSFCSTECRGASQGGRVECSCANCGKNFYKTHKEFTKSKSGNHFCSKSCAATYNNKHKTFGTRRSKLEKYLEEQLSLLYPNLKIKYNTKEEINSELDIFIPEYNLAFELNGIFHYEPIFGNNKLQQIQENDKNKFQLCQEKNISLCIIDTSSLNYFKEETAKKYFSIINNIISEMIEKN
jgi:DNA-directed RNA polymerase subunit RPC12/RpoP